jgi:hypothetical protein
MIEIELLLLQNISEVDPENRSDVHIAILAFEMFAYAAGYCIAAYHAVSVSIAALRIKALNMLLHSEDPTSKLRRYAWINRLVNLNLFKR